MPHHSARLANMPAASPGELSRPFTPKPAKATPPAPVAPSEGAASTPKGRGHLPKGVLLRVD